MAVLLSSNNLNNVRWWYHANKLHPARSVVYREVSLIGYSMPPSIVCQQPSQLLYVGSVPSEYFSEGSKYHRTTGTAGFIWKLPFSETPGTEGTSAFLQLRILPANCTQVSMSWPDSRSRLFRCSRSESSCSTPQTCTQPKREDAAMTRVHTTILFPPGRVLRFVSTW